MQRLSQTKAGHDSAKRGRVKGTGAARRDAAVSHGCQYETHFIYCSPPYSNPLGSSMGWRDDDKRVFVDGGLTRN